MDNDINDGWPMGTNELPDNAVSSLKALGPWRLEHDHSG